MATNVQLTQLDPQEFRDFTWPSKEDRASALVRFQGMSHEAAWLEADKMDRLYTNYRRMTPERQFIYWIASGETRQGSLWLVKNRAGTTLTVLDLFVEKQHRRHGVAQQAIGLMEQIAIEKGVAEIRAHVPTQDVSSVGLFHREDFEPNLRSLFVDTRTASLRFAPAGTMRHMQGQRRESYSRKIGGDPATSGVSRSIWLTGRAGSAVLVTTQEGDPEWASIVRMEPTTNTAIGLASFTRALLRTCRLLGIHELTLTASPPFHERLNANGIARWEERDIVFIKKVKSA